MIGSHTVLHSYQKLMPVKQTEVVLDLCMYHIHANLILFYAAVCSSTETAAHTEVLSVGSVYGLFP